uniref:Uncharacterized protein n=1 Tax=Triticum urartu TaxID=4572 RepID=A0A8R7PF03_TRIUA
EKKQRPHCPRTPSLPLPIPNSTIPPSRRRDLANGESATTTNPPPPPPGSIHESTAPPSGSSRQSPSLPPRSCRCTTATNPTSHRRDPAIARQPPTHLPRRRNSPLSGLPPLLSRPSTSATAAFFPHVPPQIGDAMHVPPPVTLPPSSLSSLHGQPESYPRHPALPPCSSQSTSRIRRSCTEQCHRAPH